MKLKKLLACFSAIALALTSMGVSALAENATGSGTEDDPYLLYTIDDLNALNVDNSASETPKYYKLANDIESDAKVVSFTDYWNDSEKAIIPILKNCVFDGNGKAIKISGLDSSHIFGDVRNSTLKNFNATINGTNTNLIYYSDNITMNDVDVYGDILWSTGNFGAFIAYPRHNVTMDGCDNYATLHTTTGDSTLYDAVFFGYGFPNDSTIKMNNCNNYGTLRAGRAGFLMANCSYGSAGSNRFIDVYLINSKNYGSIIACTSLANYGIYNRLVSVISDKPYAYHIRYSDTDEPYTKDTTPKWYEDEATVGVTSDLGSFKMVEPDSNLKLQRTYDNKLLITPSTNEDVDHYELSVGTYTTLKKGGSNRSYATETLQQSNDIITANLKYLSFADKTWAENNSATTTTIAGNSVYTKNGEYYYVIQNQDECTLNGNTKAPEMVSVSALDKDDNVIAVAFLESEIVKEAAATVDGKSYETVAEALDAAGTSATVSVNGVASMDSAKAYDGATIVLSNNAKLIAPDVLLKKDSTTAGQYTIVAKTSEAGTYIMQHSTSDYDQIEVKESVVPDDNNTVSYSVNINNATTKTVKITDLPTIEGNTNLKLGLIIANVPDGTTVVVSSVQ